MSIKATKKLKLADLPVQCIHSGASVGEGRPDMQPRKRESNALASSADKPLERLRGSVLRYDNPTDPVWPVEGEYD
ncbi:Uncharacterised protein [Burkholderia pseudomallei]|nr:Uncharacterised protein [Burkholderia pseudomallei]